MRQLVEEIQGALVNTEGELVGINTMTFDSGTYNGYRPSAKDLALLFQHN